MLKDHIVITDIGSTTTKAILLSKIDGKYRLVDYETAYTTVEKPSEDVNIGIQDAIWKLEAKTGHEILSTVNCQLSTDYTYLSTSSAGGGLQILVIGLTKVDSATSAQRAAFGVGGVLLDTLAIDDGRSIIEKIHILNTAHPDIILFCGGVDGGALFSVYRLAEILKLARTKQKFSDNEKLPLVFAGNKDAVDFINTLFAGRFDTHIVPNLRPTMRDENLEPTKDKIHDLFMNNVMEQAPGYPQVKKCVDADIIPTPAGVLNTLKILGKQQKNIIAFDIGGATTDIFSYINGNYQRTVSANFGMSYSIGNILGNYDLGIMNYEGDNSYFLNYIGNKILYPGFNPDSDLDKYIEHIMAIKGIQLSTKQHFDMHFRTKRIGFLDNLITMPTRDKWKETMYYPHYDSSFIFSMSDVEVMIGAGGVIAHSTREQAIYMMIESLKPLGITELWRDKHFISPHLGVLATVDEDVAADLINTECFEKLAIYIKPQLKRFKDDEIALTVYLDSIEFGVKSNDVFVYRHQNSEDRPQTTEIKIKAGKYCLLKDTTITLLPDVSLIIDTRNPKKIDTDLIFKSGDWISSLLDKSDDWKSPLLDKSSDWKSSLLDKLKAYSIDPRQKTELRTYHPPEAHYSLSTIHYSLPYEGNIYVQLYDDIQPDTLIGENKFEPPQIYVILISAIMSRTFTETEIKEGLLIAENDTVVIGQKIFIDKANQHFLNSNDTAYSPVRGVIEKINYATGTIILREIQDYPLKPITVDIAKPLNIKEKEIKGYLKKRLGDFVFAGETLAINTRDMYGQYRNVISRHTGTIKEIDTQKGTITIVYDKKPYQIYAQAYGKVTKITSSGEVQVEVNTCQIEGKIGFGKDIGGVFDKEIVYQKHIDDFDQLVALATKGVTGLICETMPYSILKRFLGRDIGVALTGGEDLPFSLIILNGFADVPVSVTRSQAFPPSDEGRRVASETNLPLSEGDRGAAFFSQFTGKYTLLKPHTQIRAGATRPQIMVFLPPPPTHSNYDGTIKNGR